MLERQANLLSPIPNLSELRQDKPVYDTRYPIDEKHPLHNDPLVDVREITDEQGINVFEDAISYYARPNKMTGEKLPGVPDAPLVRLDVAKRLLKAETFLRTNREVREALGSPAHLAIRDALRPHQVQRFAHDVAWPMIIRRENPDLSDEEVLKKADEYCGKPKDTPTPTPHATGGAVDVSLTNLEGEPFDRGHTPGGVKGTAYPEFHEGYHLHYPNSSDIESSREDVAKEGSEIILGRRVLYYAMTEVAGLYPNPNEIWHYGKGDPLSTHVSGEPPYYGVAELPGWYTQEMEKLQEQGE